MPTSTASRSRALTVTTLTAHRPIHVTGRLVVCSCESLEEWDSTTDHADHIADALAEVLAPQARSASVTPAHLRVLVLLSEARGDGVTDTQLARRWAVKVSRPSSSWPLISDAGIRSRRAELVAWRIAEEVPGIRGRTLTNRPTRLWRLSDGSAAQLPPLDARTRQALADLLDEAGTDVVTRAALELARATASAQ